MAQNPVADFGRDVNSWRDIDFWHWTKVVLRGMGQVIFQGHAGTGLCFLLGFLVASPYLAAGGLLAAIIGPVLATWLKYDKQEIEDGIHGFNPTLVGIATLFYLDPKQFLPWLFLIAGAALSVLVTKLLRTYVKFPTYTAPFILVTWALLLLANGLEGRAIDHKPEPPGSHFVPHTFVEMVLAGDAEIMFGANMQVGLLFVVGVAISNWRHAVLLFGGSFVATLTAVYHNDPQESLAIGIYGYNAALAAVAVYLWRKSLLYPILAAIAATPLTEFFPKALGIPPLTAPFVVASWMVIVIGSLETYFCAESSVIEPKAVGQEAM